MIPNADLAIALATEHEAGRLHDPAVPSLLKAWSDGGWTRRQAAKVRVILSRADPRPGERRAIPPAAYDDGCPWWIDTRPERQALRGRKSGIVRRWRTRERDELIHRWYRRGKRTVAEMAAHFGMSRQGIYYAINRVLSAPLPRLAPVKLTIQYLRRLAERIPRKALRRSQKPDPEPCRTKSEDDPLLKRPYHRALAAPGPPRLVKRPQPRGSMRGIGREND